MQFVKKVQIHKGWSDDKKYYVETENQQKYLLRIYSSNKKERCQHDFIMHQKLTNLNIPIPTPIKTGTCDEGTYILQSWIDGNEARDVIKNFNNKQQYEYGIEAGKILKKIHSVCDNIRPRNLQIIYNQKIDNKIQNYNNCPLQYVNGYLFIEFIKKHRYLLNNCEYTFIHGDFHLGNMMIDNNNKLYIIDFNRCSYGDPINEFDRMVWNAKESPLFSTGLINGYFENNVPDYFWKLMALHISLGTISSLPWAIDFHDEKEINTMVSMAQNVLNWYNNFNNIIPCWYINQPIL